ncbi:MAG: alpha/beta hydrolase [Rhodospirillales bacterium]|nr:alpha/beta hydrolase [Rhodospirillales bacterium]
MTLDPQAKMVLDIAEKSGRPLLESLAPVEARKLYEGMAKVGGGKPPKVFKTEDLEADGPFGAIPLRVYTPRDPKEEKLPVLIYIHGGGYVIGSRDSHDVPCRYLALEGDCIVVSVDYRMAPEFPFPQPVEDCWAAAKWIAANVESFGGRADKIAIGGDSAGGNLSTVLCAMAKEQSGPNFVYQLLIYPGIDMTGSFASHEALSEGYRLTKPLINWFMDAYFSGDNKDRKDPLCSPYFAKDLSGLPPALIISAGYDPLKDENAAYHRMLLKAGVKSQHSHYSGMIHGFINMPAFLDAAKDCLKECGSGLKAAFAQL